MTDYNDGNWHGWNGGERPVHPKSIVDMVWPSFSREDEAFRSRRKAERFSWSVGGESPPMLFRVIEPYLEPNEVWLVGKRAFDSEDKAKTFLSVLRRDHPETDLGSEWEPRLFREVLE